MTRGIKDSVRRETEQAREEFMSLGVSRDTVNKMSHVCLRLLTAATISERDSLDNPWKREVFDRLFPEALKWCVLFATALMDWDSFKVSPRKLASALERFPNVFVLDESMEMSPKEEKFITKVLGSIASSLAAFPPITRKIRTKS